MPTILPHDMDANENETVCKPITGGMSKHRQYLSIDETAALLGVSKETLRTWRYRRQGPDFYKPTPQTVLYEAGELDAFMEERRIECRR